jgi:hypothetical protein
MKRLILPLFLTLSLVVPLIGHADGYPEDLEPSKPRVSRARVQREAEAPAPAPAACVPSSESPRVQVISLNPDQKVKKIMGEITECVTTQWDMMKMFSGPNTIGLSYPDEKEMWGYLWLWSYKLQNPIEETVIQMGDPGKRVMKGKNPVELYVTFNESDVVERVKLVLVKKKNSKY